MWAVVPAAGIGTRLGAKMPKQYLPLGDRSILETTLNKLASHPQIDGIMVALAENDKWYALGQSLHGKPVLTCVGGAQRCDSVMAGLQALRNLNPSIDWVCVHDAARPLISHTDLDALFRHCSQPDGAILAAPVADTIKRGNDRIDATVPRSGLWRALTPQAFPLAVLMEALESAQQSSGAITDEASAVEKLGLQPRLVAGSNLNFKITTAEDYAMAQQIVGDSDTQRVTVTGSGFDVHAFGEGDGIVLGGVRIDHDRALSAHSDGDVLLHAICDALLGATAMGDIGVHFPPDDPHYKNASSRDLLTTVAGLLKGDDVRVLHVDSTVICQRPKLQPHINAMRRNIADDLGLPIDFVSVKATTTEHLGFTGREEGIAVQAVATVSRALD